MLLQLAADPRRLPGNQDAATPVDRALAGQSVDDELLWTTPDGDERRVHVVAAPVRSSDGEVRAAAVIARDITRLYGAISGRARLDGAVKTARRVTHELSNQLSPVVGYADLLAQMVQGEAAVLAQRIVWAGTDAAGTLARLDRIVRFAETEFGGQVMLDLDAATTDRRQLPRRGST